MNLRCQIKMRNHILESDTALGETMRKSLATKLDQISLGETYYEHALVEAKNLTFITKAELTSINQHLYGNTAPEHCTRLQEVAIKLRTLYTEPVTSS